jgi:peptidoglycan-N-acetylglucosamine deacetylase
MDGHTCRDTGSTTSTAPVPGVMSRRVLLSLGAVSLTAACTHAANSAAPAGSLSGSEAPGDSHSRPHTPATPTPTRTSTSAWKPPAVARPIAGRCPAINHVVQHLGGPQCYVPCHGTNIGLTIDDGPHPTWTPLVLKLLARYHITATFCLIGRNAAAHPALVAAIHDGGHEIANHTWTHPLPFTTLTATQVADEIHRTSDLLTHLTGTAPTLFRAPGGEWNPTVLAQVKTAGLKPLDWSIDPRDWSRPGVPHIVDTILRQTRPGAIILEHDGGGNRQQTVDALTIALPRLLDAGYTFVTPTGHGHPVT